jgi:DNA-binding NarL/FixJ family response regulator
MSESEGLITVLIAEDDALLRHFLVQRLADQDDFTVVGSVANGREALEATEQLRPSVLLLDLGLPELSGLQVLERLPAGRAAPRVLVLTGDESEEAQIQAIRHGARGFLGKSEAGPALPDAIRAIAAGEVWLSGGLVRRIVDDYPTLVRRVQEQDGPIGRLTDREREVLVRIGQGMTNQQIAAALAMSVSTVKVYIRSLFKKLDLPNRAGAAVFASREGLLEPAAGRSASPNRAR